MGDVSLHLGEFEVFRGLPGSAAVFLHVVAPEGDTGCHYNTSHWQYKANAHSFCALYIEPVDRLGSIQM